MVIECRDTVRRTLEGDPRSVSGLSYDPARSVSNNIVSGQIIFFDRRAEKDSVMFGAGATSSNLCPPGMMCKLDCLWLSLYLFVCLGGWPVGIRAQLDLANRILLGIGWESSDVVSGDRRLFPI